MHDCENVCKGSDLYERLNQFAEYQVTKHFGLSLLEFLEFPTDICDEILDISARRLSVEGSTASNILAQLQANKST